MAPTYPECDEDDLLATLEAISEIKPLTVFHEPINIRAENVARIAKHAATVGMAINTEVFQSTEEWRKYAMEQLDSVESLAEEVGLLNHLHLWPDKALGTKAAIKQFKGTSDLDTGYEPWLNYWWNRISEWPK